MQVKVSLKMEIDGVPMMIETCLEVNLAPSGLYIASSPSVSPVISSGGTPQSAVLSFLDDMLYHRMIEMEQVG